MSGAHLRVESVVALDDLRARLHSSPGRLAEPLERVRGAMRALVASVREEVARRDAELRNCGDPDLVAWLRARLEAALAALALAEDVAARVRSVATRVETEAERHAGHGAAELDGIARQIDAVDAPAEAAAAAGAVALTAAASPTRAGASGAAAGRMPGALPATLPAASWDALRALGGRAGETLGGRLRAGAITAEDAGLIERVDAAFAVAEPLHEWMTFDRVVERDFFDSLVPGSSGDAVTTAALDASAALEEPAYLSTSKPGGRYGSPSAVHLRVDVPPGTPAIDMTALHPDGDPIGPWHGEREMLLPRGGYLVALPESARRDPATGALRLTVTYLRLP